MWSHGHYHYPGSADYRNPICADALKMMLGCEQARKIIKQLAQKRLGVFLNLFARREAKTGLTILDIFFVQKFFLENISKRNVNNKPNNNSTSNIL